jgi:exodeoxyribonuclease V alpha subunit
LQGQPCAPTGKAAARMQESISNAMVSLKDLDIPEDIIHKISILQATTIHSLLGYIHGSIAFRHNNNNLLKTDVLIVDECSMIDLSLFYKLLQAVDTTSTKVILLGDKNQLASVDAGSIFRDLCNETMEMNTFSSERLEFINDFIELPQNKIKQGNLKAQIIILYSNI